jgi:hypothetical protein
MTTIQPNTTIKATFIGDSDLTVTALVKERKGDFVILLLEGKLIRKKVKKTYDGREYVLAYGSYSMAPAFYPSEN